MTRAGAIVAGLVVGVLAAGLVASALVTILPPQWRGAGLVWTVTVVVVALTMWGFWAASTERRD